MSGGPCRDCFSGVINSGTPTGSESVIHGLPTYVAQPHGQPKGLVVIISDAFGWTFSNTRVLADKYAKTGDFLVYVPDVMKDSMVYLDKVTAPSSWFSTIFLKPYYMVRAMLHFVPFLIRCRPAVAKPAVFDFFRALRSSPDTTNLKIGVAGFCWGGKFTVLLAQDAPSSRVHKAGSEAGEPHSLVDAAFTAHPSLLQVPEDITPVSVPLSIAIGDVDMALKKSLVEQAKEILEKKKAGDHECIIYPGAKHGFAVRGDPDDPRQKELGEQAETQALSWFAKWLTK
ncbi:MAG: hypothetical protein M1818_004099 [Claussenomyces sp. TS43310]|nr:MAG: hypothetical protein M1818_004099 [Claussenomyces sp. TS43310]